MKNAVAYLRVSGASQVEGNGFDRQLMACHGYAALHGMSMTEVFREEAISGTTTVEQRPAFQELVAYMLENNITTLLVERLDRLARELAIQQQLIMYLAAKQLQLISCDTGENITEAVMSDPMRRAMVQIQGIFAELDKSMIVAKLRKGRERTKVVTGRCEGRKPFGRNPKAPEERETLERILDLRALGHTSDYIANYLNARSVPTRSSARWRGTTVAKIMRREASDTRQFTKLAHPVL